MSKEQNEPRKQKDRNDGGLDRWERGDGWFKGFPFHEDLFEGFEREFREMESRMNAMMEEARHTEPGEGGPYVYGYRVHVGPDGVPQVEEWGNVKREDMPRIFSHSPLGAPVHQGERGRPLPPAGEGGPTGSEVQTKGVEPYCDIMEGEKDCTVTLEMPGVEREDIDIREDGDALVVETPRTDRHYFKRVKLPDGVNLKKIKATYKNGVLDISLPRKRLAKKKKGRKIKVD